MSRPSPTSKNPAFINGLAKGLAMIQIFNEEHTGLTLAEAAARTGMTRATARRVLMTLEELGFATRIDARRFVLTPRVLSLGCAYLSTMPFWSFAAPVLESLVDELGATCSIAVLDYTELVYVMRIPIRRILSYTGITIGSRLPIYCNSMGRVLLASMDDHQLDNYLANTALIPLTPYTITDPEKLRSAVIEARRKGYAWVHGEMEETVGGLAVPLFSADGSVIAALNASVNQQASDLRTEDEVLERFLLSVRRAAKRLNASLLLNINQARQYSSTRKIPHRRKHEAPRTSGH
ncbi:HTH domain-containing protein [Allopusillimonas soli]|uniref:Helix-turn-helix domain-containing protein n=1 Tax=Allopusillimonas soli TaxID=659016 RepID=A0A853FGC3_9BURK|nr:IclR family transcriptional regulator C-terminal domain-containing protein [Allopusillimonas soli]NYT38728.1 helix-turn-helix domain-containing protein [Allopusillimonas soli]TEA71578.1 HTH domain-containing protein [Allopusillimonas soli]